MAIRDQIQRTHAALKLRRAGFINSLIIVQEAERAGLPLSYAAALLEKESGKGQNVFGHDAVRNPIKGGPVTESRYLGYKRYRDQGLGAQGVGPCQLTYPPSQDAADKMGGCWKPRYNMRVGFKQLADLVHAYGLKEGSRRYNGVGPAAEAYSRDFIAKQAHWHHVL